jgi:hypothetical protein
MNNKNLQPAPPPIHKGEEDEEANLKTAYENGIAKGYKDGRMDEQAYQAQLKSLPSNALREALFIKKNIKLSSGIESDFKIECDALTEDDIECIAYLFSKKLKFKAVQGILTGGVRLANAMAKYMEPDPLLPLLICDDVLTTGASMEKIKESDNCIGAVIFARGECPSWVTPLFTMLPKAAISANPLRKALEECLAYLKGQETSTKSVLIKKAEAAIKIKAYDKTSIQGRNP